MSFNRVETTGFISVSNMKVGATADMTVGQNNDMKIVLKNTCKGDIEIPIFQSNQTYILGVNGYTHVCDDVVINCGRTSVTITFVAANGGIDYTIVQESDFRKTFIVPEVTGVMDFVITNVQNHNEYTLTKNIATGTSVSITRNGISNYTGNVVYEGDQLVISASTASDYSLENFIVNGSSRTSPYTLTVTGDVTVSTQATQKMWRTIHSGSTIVVSDGSSYTLNGLRGDAPTKIAMTGGITSVNCDDVCGGYSTSSANATASWNTSSVYNTSYWEVNGMGTASSQGWDFTITAEASCYFSTNKIHVSASASGGNEYGWVTGANASFSITRIEQYY